MNEPEKTAEAAGIEVPADLLAKKPDIQFFRVARAGQIPEGYVRRFFANDLEMCLARFHGKAYATSNYCTHLDCLLSAGKLLDDGIGCSCHGSVFDLETGDAIFPPATEPISTYPVIEREGDVYVGITPADFESGGPRRRDLRK